MPDGTGKNSDRNSGKTDSLMALLKIPVNILVKYWQKPVLPNDTGKKYELVSNAMVIMMWVNNCNRDIQ